MRQCGLNLLCETAANGIVLREQHVNVHDPKLMVETE